MAGRSTAEIGRLVLLFAFLAALIWASEPTSWSVLAGVPFVAIGEAVRLWAAGHLFKTQELITSGPYRFTRNPLYLGRFLLLTGFALMARFPQALDLGRVVVPANVLALIAGYAVFFGYYMPRKERIEPARLLSLHGEKYRAYRDAIPALFPTWRAWPDNGERWRAERMKRNREEITAAVVALIVVVFAVKAYLLPS